MGRRAGKDILSIAVSQELTAAAGTGTGLAMRRGHAHTRRRCRGVEGLYHSLLNYLLLIGSERGKLLLSIVYPLVTSPGSSGHF